jgi:DNA-binding NtrC family response regulator/tetratricopeptide (TPR) repeat protein
MATAFMFLGRHFEAEIAYQDALVIFRRHELALSLAITLNDYAILKKKLGCYADANAMLREAIRRLDTVGVVRTKIQAVANLGVVEARSGDWSAAEKRYRRAALLLSSYGLTETSPLDTQLQIALKGKVEHLDLLRRRYATVEGKLHALVDVETDDRVAAILCEYLADLYTETENYDKAEEYLQRAYIMTQEILPESDVMTEVLRRQAQLAMKRDQLGESRNTALRCILLSKKIGDRYELGAATRVLGEVYAAQGNVKRAQACFATAIHGLKSIHECYELMRALYAQGMFFARQTKRDEAEISLLEARQLAKKLELDYYQALIAIGLVDVLTPQERWSEASTWLAEATALRDNLEGIDRERVEKGLQRSANELQQAITRASVREAETLKTICRVYEDARFPIAEMKPDLAYQVAQSVGGECLFVVGRKGSGFTVPLTYNISVNEAKDIVRHLDAAPKKPLFGLESGPQVMATQNARTLVAVPCYVAPNGTGKDRPAELYAFCTRFDGNVTVTPRQMELLYASSEALARLIEDEGERHAQATPEEQARIRHPRGSFKEILTIDADMIKLIKVAERAAGSVAPILLEGETGVGKELFARAIHGASKRNEGPFVAVNAGGMSVSLLESELFGHVRGAFTDASSDRLGFIETARGGTLFLDEVGEMGEELQVKLLRLLENGEYRRLGESSVRKADVRVISATNRDLKKEADRGNFRLDLYYRVAPLRLTIPPLRMRACDIQLMVRHFLRDCAQLNGIADRYIEIDVKAMEALELYDWPGNVRELYNEILRVVSLIGRGDLVRFTMLSEGIQDYLQAKKRGTDGLLERSVEQYERRLILHALEKNDWNHLRTAEAIGVPRTTLLAKLKRLNIASK